MLISGRVDSNRRLPAPHAGALTRLRYAPLSSIYLKTPYLQGVIGFKVRSLMFKDLVSGS